MLCSKSEEIPVRFDLKRLLGRALGKFGTRSSADSWQSQNAQVARSWTSPDASAFPPIFVRGMSRSGGTLLVTLLDAHPDIAMSYELYPGLLAHTTSNRHHPKSAEFGEGADTGADLREVVEILETFGPKAFNVLSERDLKDVQVFLARAGRSGVVLPTLTAILKAHLSAGQNLAASEDRLRLIERVALEKMRSENKQLWGLKCSGRYEQYHEIWPSAYFINIIRDGRDVLASQQNTGNFRNSPKEVARSWVNTHMQFRKLVERPDVNAVEIFYEKLAHDPESEVRRLCDFLELAFSPEMLGFHSSDLSIFRNPKGHLSIDRILKPIDTSKIGRWKQDLSENDLAEFNSEAHEAMALFGYS